MAFSILSDSILLPRQPRLCLADRNSSRPLKKKKQQQKEFKTVGFADLNDTSSQKNGRKKTPLIRRGSVTARRILLVLALKLIKTI